MPILTRTYIEELAQAPLSAEGVAALEGYLALPGVADIVVPPELPLHAMLALDLGVPLGLLRGVLSASGLKQHIADYIVERGGVGYSNDWRWSELQAGAIMRALGADVTFVERARVAGQKTPDIRARWAKGSAVDVEVTRAERRAGHTEVSRGLETLAGAVGASGHHCHYLILFDDASSKKALEEALDAIVRVEAGQSIQSEGRWFVMALLPKDRELLIEGKAEALFAPSWWRKGRPVAFALMTAIGSAFQAYLRMASQYTEVDYLNPIRRKAERNQGTAGNSFIIALDVSELPAAHEKIGDELPNYFETWPKVSGVLLFAYIPWTGYSRKEWWLSFHRNPKALIPPPRELTLGSERSSLVFTLTES
jgi:hypothetical protein